VLNATLAHALQMLALNDHSERARTLFDAMPKEASYDGQALLRIGDALAVLKHDAAVEWLVRAAESPDTIFSERISVGIALTRLDAYPQAFGPINELLAARPGAFNTHPEILETVVKGGGPEAVQQLTASFESLCAYPEHAEFLHALADAYNDPSGESLDALTAVAALPQLNAHHLQLAADVLEEAGRDARPVYKRLAKHAGDSAGNHAALARLIELEVEAGAWADAIRRLADFAHEHDGHAETAARAIRDAATADDWPALVAEVEAMFSEEPSHPGASEVLALLARIADPLGESFDVNAMPASEAERAEARRYAELITKWRFTETIPQDVHDPFDNENMYDALTKILAEHQTKPVETFDSRGMIDLSALLTNDAPWDAHSIRVGEAIIESPTAKRVTLHTGGTGAMLWCNGRRLTGGNLTGPYADLERFEVDLEAGKNRLVIRLMQGSFRPSPLDRPREYLQVYDPVNGITTAGATGAGFDRSYFMPLTIGRTQSEPLRLFGVGILEDEPAQVVAAN
jgi:hypothetical protein